LCVVCGAKVPTRQDQFCSSQCNHDFHHGKKLAKRVWEVEPIQEVQLPSNDFARESMFVPKPMEVATPGRTSPEQTGPTCVECGAQLTGKRTRFCSERCSQRASDRRRSRHSFARRESRAESKPTDSATPAERTSPEHTPEPLTQPGKPTIWNLLGSIVDTGLVGRIDLELDQGWTVTFRQERSTKLE
jgi:predicted nucleic acid-binding Zn ribbon protein